MRGDGADTATRRTAPAREARVPSRRTAGRTLLRLTRPAELAAVRVALVRAMAALEPLRLTSECRAATELALAEVLNNVVEHAYAQGSGPVTLELRLAGGCLACTVRDRGRPMPNAALPEPAPLPALAALATADLPEGGFGWHLILTLARDLDYVRVRGGNRLSFLLPLERDAVPG